MALLKGLFRGLVRYGLVEACQACAMGPGGAGPEGLVADLEVEGVAQQPGDVRELTADAHGQPQQPWHMAMEAQRQLSREDRAHTGGLGRAVDGRPGQGGHVVTVDARRAGSRRWNYQDVSAAGP